MPKKTFRDAVDAAEYLQWKPGLQALKKGEGKGRIRANDSQRLLGSSSIDDDCVRAFPTASRWDYVIGYERSGKAVAHFVEVHSAITCEVSTMHKKRRWLDEFLQRPSQSKLAKLRREVHWVASDKIAIPKSTRQYRQLAQIGLKPVERLELT